MTIPGTTPRIPQFASLCCARLRNHGSLPRRGEQVASVKDRRTQAFLRGALEPGFNAIVERRQLELLWATRAVSAFVHTNIERLTSALDVIPAGGTRTCVDILFLLDDLDLYDSGVQFEYFAEGAIEPLLSLVEERVRTRTPDDPYWQFLELLSSRHDFGGPTEWLIIKPREMTVEQFAEILPASQGLRSPAMRECVRLLYFAQDAEWQLRISQVDWLISAMSKNILPTLSTSQIDALSWCMSGADSFDEATSKYSLLLKTPFGLHRARRQILQSKIKSLNRLSDALAAQRTVSVDTPESRDVTAVQVMEDIGDWPESGPEMQQ